MNRSVEIIDSNVIIKRCKLVGSASSLFWEYDSLSLGKLALGNYHIIYILNHVERSQNDSSCNLFTQPVDTAYLDFIVSEPNAIAVNHTDNRVIIFPNPTDSKLNLRLTSPPNDKLIFQILTTDGRVLMQEKITNQPNLDIDVSALPTGLYFIKLQDEKQCWIKRFVKSRFN